MDKQLRVVIFENNEENVQQYANELFDSLSNIEATVVNVYDKRPCTQLLPVRAIPNIGILIFADSLEENTVENMLKQLEYFQHQKEIEEALSILGISFNDESEAEENA